MFMYPVGFEPPAFFPGSNANLAPKTIRPLRLRCLNVLKTYSVFAYYWNELTCDNTWCKVLNTVIDTIYIGIRNAYFVW